MICRIAETINRGLSYPFAKCVLQLPDNAIVDPERASILRDPHTGVSVDDPSIAQRAKKRVTRITIARQGAQARRQSEELFHGIIETSLCGPVGINETRVMADAMGHEAERRLLM